MTQLVFWSACRRLLYRHRNQVDQTRTYLTFNKAYVGKIDSRVINVEEYQQHDGRVFPLVITPEDAHSAHLGDTADWSRKVSRERFEILSSARYYGAILFRGFFGDDVQSFSNFADSFKLKPFLYEGGSAPRKHVIGNVYTANEGPPDEDIYLHHEMSYAPRMPRWIFFYCRKAADSGGETPIAMSSELAQQMQMRSPLFVTKLLQYPLVYERIIPEFDSDKSFIGGGWRTAFSSESKEEAEMKCRQLGYSCQWLPDNELQLSITMPGLTADYVTGKIMWRNHLAGFTCQAVKSKRTVRFTNGESIPATAMQALDEAMEKSALNIKWQTGDVILIDNFRAMHGRRAFVPPREHLVSLYY